MGALGLVGERLLSGSGETPRHIFEQCYYWQFIFMRSFDTGYIIFRGPGAPSGRALIGCAGPGIVGPSQAGGLRCEPPVRPGSMAAGQVRAPSSKLPAGFVVTSPEGAACWLRQAWGVDAGKADDYMGEQ